MTRRSFKRPRPRRQHVSLGAIGLLAVTAGIATPAPGSAASVAFPTTGAGTQSVVVRAAPGQLAVAEVAVDHAGGRVVRSLGVINGFSAVVPRMSIDQLKGDPSIAEVSLDAAVTMDSVNPTLGYDPTNDNGSLHSIEAAIGAPKAWAAGATGAGVDVALIDTGVSTVSGLDAPGKVTNGPDLSIDARVPGQASLDGYGHGTHMASIIAGRDDAATTPKQYNDPSTFVGVAPDAGIVNVRVGSQSGAVDISQVIAGIDWVVQNAHSDGHNIKVLNLSFGTNSTQPYTLDPVDYAAEVAWQHGIVVVASAGNDGSATTTLEDPADDPFVVAVGAENTDSGGVVHGSSVAGFTNVGNAGRTVDLLAPGVHVLGLDVPGSAIDTAYPSARVGTRFFRGSGTSQAAAVVSGAFALLAQAYPSATPDQLKYLMTATAQPLKNVTTLSQGHGVLQVDKAIAVGNQVLQATQDQETKSSKASKPNKVTPKEAGTSLLNQITQPWVSSTGTGSFDAARGGSYLVDPNGQPLHGPEDIWGGSVDTTALAAQEAAGTSWANGTWNGNNLLGDGSSPTLWDGMALSGVDFNGMRWTSLRWTGSGWSSLRWTDQSWSGMRWTDDGWESLRWTGKGWS